MRPWKVEVPVSHIHLSVLKISYRPKRNMINISKNQIVSYTNIPTYSTDIIHLPFGMYWDLTVNET